MKSFFSLPSSSFSGSFYIKVFILCLIILLASLYSYFQHEREEETKAKKDKQKEGMTNNSTILLLGDSILNNEAYVKNGKSIVNLLKEKSDQEVDSYAVNNASIIDIYQQLNNVPLDLNDENTSLFLSVGGNDILTTFEDEIQNENDGDRLKPIFNAYKKLVTSIQTKMNKVGKITLLNLYYPTNMKYQQYKPILEEWNRLLDQYTREKNLNILRLNYLLTQSTDFSLSIEPSESGGMKIADNIILNA